MQKKYRRMLIMLAYILVVSSTIAYSALTSSLQLNAEAKLRTISDIRVTGISLSSANGGTLQYESVYDVDTITSGFVLPTTDSSITYKVTVTNNGTIDQTIYDILTQSSNNSGLYYEISGYNVRDVIGFKSVVEFYITYKTTTPSEEPINVVNKFNFKKVYHVTFEAKGGTSITDGIKYEGVDLSLSTFTSTKQGYILSGWTDEQDGTTVKYQTNGTYTLDRDLILYAVWEGNPNTSYSVNHYVHDLGTNTYTLDSTDNLTGTTDSTLTLASLKKTIPGFTYVDGYLTGGTTKPTEGAVTTTTILADGSRVINLYYRRNYLYVQYHVNGGQLAEQHSSWIRTSGDLITFGSANRYLNGVYGSKVGNVDGSTYSVSNVGLNNYNNSSYINIIKNGYIGKNTEEWNTKADGTGTSYYQDGSDYDANTFGGVDLSTGDQVVTLYVNWVPVNYEIQYDLQGGTLATSNPATYNIETNTFTLNNPTLTGYTFTGWTGSNGNTPQTTVTIPAGSTGDKAYIANWTANTYTVTANANGGSIASTTGWTGTGNTSTKSVTYDNAYGTLPTVSRTSYTFKGWSLLPEGYTQVEYIESSGTQYILTDVVPSSKFKIETDVYISAYGNQPTIAGVSDNNCIQFYYDNTPSVWTKGGSIKDSESYYKQKIHYIAEANSSGLKLDVNGKVYTGPYSYNGGTSNHLMIFAYNINDNAKFPLSGRIYTLKLFDDSELIRNFVPCINNTTGKAGLYDLVTNTFYGNSGTGDFIAGDEEFITSETIVKETSNHTLKAIWEAVNYEITYDLQGGTLSAANPATYNIETNTFTLNNPTLTGYTFTGWTGSNGNTPQTTVTIPAGSTGDKAYIANWQANNYTVTADANGGSIPSTTGWTGTGATSTKSVTYDSQYGTLPTPTRDNYIFRGWNGKNILKTTQQSYTLPASLQSTIVISSKAVHMEAGQKYYISYNIDNNSNSNGRSTPIIKLNETNYYENTAVNYNLVTGRKIWEFTPIVSGDATIYYWLHTSDVDVTVSNFMISTTNNIVYEPYYVTSSTNVTQAKDHTLKAIWDLKESTLLPGEQFNAKMKQLAGDQDATWETSNTNITSIVRSNSLTIMPTDDNVVSTSSSNTPIYAWFDSNSGTLYYYTDAVNLYMNANAHAMFYNLKNTTSIDLSNINTSKTVNMQSLFNSDSNLTGINVSNFDTSNVTNMQAMFKDCSSLSTLDISSFNTSNVITMYYMFNNCSALTSLDLSGFDMSKMTNTESVLTNMTSLKSLKTPSIYPTDSSVKITLPKTLIDASGNEYTELDNTSPTNTMLNTLTTFLPGSQFNIKTKKLANPTLDNITAYTVDTNITGIQRSNTLPSGFVPTSDNTISTSDSYYPIYAWFDNGTIYYYTEALKPYTNEDMYHMFYNFGSIETIDLSGISTKKTTNMSTVFGNCNNLHTITLDNNFDSSNVTTMSYMFYNSPITTIDLTKINTSKVTNMSYMFAYTHIANPNLNSFNTSNVEDMSYMFYSNVYSSTMTFGSNFVTSKVSNMEGMFGQCTYLTSLDLSGFNTSNVVNMSKMFYNVSRNTTISLNLNNFNTSKVTNMGQMFFYTQLTSLDISSFDMSLVTDTTSMFTGVNTITELKTPKVYPSEAVIQLPKTLYDPSGNGWSVLDSSSPTETWLHKMICKRATTLHTETCSQTSDSLYCSGAGYKVGGSKNTSTITYGNLGTNDSTLNGGDAFTCDVNGDGTFNEATERFYYVGDYYNTTTKEFETDTGVLVYYNNVSAGVANNTATSEYDTSGENWHGPVTAITQLPTTSQWTNIRLKNDSRAILSYNNGSMTDGGTLPSDFSYSGYSARLLTVQEINHSLNRTLSDVYYRLDDVAPYLFENTQYSSPNLKIGWWLETTDHNSASALRMMIGYESYYVNGIYPAPVSNSSGMGVRPAIEVNKNFLNKKVNAYLITYDTNGGSENTTQTVTVGDSLDSLSVPTREGYTFAGWYTEASGGTQITTATVPTATTTYYAHWTPINYNIIYDLDGGTVATNNPSTYNADSNSITLNNPTKTGYTFAGWSGGKNLLNYNNLQQIAETMGIVVDSEGNISDTSPTSDGRGWNVASNQNWQTKLTSGTYIISIDFSTKALNSSAQTYASIGVLNIDTGLMIKDSKIGELYNKGNFTYVFTISKETNIGILIKAYDGIYKVQLEKADTSTKWEPYVINETTLTIPSGSVGNRKYTANWTANSYTVTAEANGGSIPTTTGWTGTGNTATKSVTYDSQYGTLPTPTRNGYTFKGWNGKNKFDENKFLLLSNYTISNSYYKWAEIQLKGNTTYKISINRYNNFDGTNKGYLLINKTTNPNVNWVAVAHTNGSTNDNNASYTFTTESDGLLYIGYNSQMTQNDLTDIWNNTDLQIEEGTTATPYEPYYVTSSTNVTQAKDHTLKAKWEMNTYEITYDLQGGSLANSNPATYNVETQTFTLNNPTLTGQTFIGWTGSNGNTPEVNVTIPVGSYGDKAYVAHFSPIYEPETRIRSLNTIGTTIADDDPDSNLRFIGANPSNYVSFNGQKWRIIGVFDGKLKIIGDSIGNYSWDTSRNTVNNGYGVNQWGPSGTYTGADLMKLLNPGYSSNTDLKCNTTITYTDGIYNCGDNTDSNYTSGLVNNSLWWNAESGYCYNNVNYSTTACDFTTTGLQSNTARNMIDNATWYLGSVNASQNIWAANTFTASFAYNFERGNLNGKQCSSGPYCTDTVDRTTTWQGKVGLLYPSDYIYATGGGSTYNRNTCLTVHAGNVSDNSVSNWNNTYTDCKNNDWLLPSSWTWSLSPRAYSSDSIYVFTVLTAGYVYGDIAMFAGSVRPVVYLKSSIKFTTGDGSYNSPFNLIDTE